MNTPVLIPVARFCANRRQPGNPARPHAGTPALIIDKDLRNFRHLPDVHAVLPLKY